MARLTLILVTLSTLHFNIASAFRFQERDGGAQGVVQVGLRNVHNQLYTAHVQMANPPVWYNFSIALTQAYSAVIGVGCTNCSTDSTQNAKPYNPTTSSSYVFVDPSTTVTVAGKTITGELVKENCGFRQTNGQWWQYKNQSLIVAGAGSDSSSLAGGGGIAGFGQTGATDPKNTLIDQYLTSNQSTLSQFVFALALYDQSVTQASNGVALQGDSSGGFMHLTGSDPSFYTGTIQSFPVAGSDVSQSWGSVPGQLGGYDWTVQTQGWLLKTAAGDVTGSQGMYGTMEPSYPYILIPQADANKLYAAIPGSTAYVLPPNAVDSKGNTVYQDNLALSWSIPCNMNNVKFYVNFQGVSIPLQPSDFMTQIGSTCVGTVKGWADSTRQTGILGNSFFRNAYIVFTATTNPSSNTVGLANRPLIADRSKDGATRGIVVGAVVGGLVFLLCIGIAIFFVARHWKSRRRAPPSAIFTGAPSGGSIEDDYTTEKRHSVRNTTSSSFLSTLATGKSSNLQNYVAEPWLPPPSPSTLLSTSGGAGSSREQGVVVAPWTPKVPSEQAFLSPTGNALDTTVAALPYSPPSSMSGTSSSGYNLSTQRPVSGQSYISYSPIPMSESPMPTSGSVTSGGAGSIPNSPTPLLGTQQRRYSGATSSQYHAEPSQYHAGPASSSQYHAATSAGSQQQSFGAPSAWQYQSGQTSSRPTSHVPSIPPGARQRSLPPPPGQGNQPY